MLIRTLLLLIVASSLSAQTRTVFSGQAGTQDGWVNRNSTSTTYGSADTMQLENTGSAYSVAYFKATNIGDSISADKIVTLCTLYVYIKDVTGSKQIESRKACKRWEESGIIHEAWGSPSFLKGWGTDPGMNTTTDCLDCDNNTNGSGNDRAGPVGTSATFSSTGWVAIPVDTCHANAWVSGDDINNGVQLFDNALASNFNTLSMYSSEDATNPPEFVFIHTAGGSSSQVMQVTTKRSRR